MKMIFDEFQGKTAIITGAASGMGLLCAQRLAENGANVVMADADEEAVRRKAQAIAEQGGSAMPAVVDVRFTIKWSRWRRKRQSNLDTLIFW